MKNWVGFCFLIIVSLVSCKKENEKTAQIILNNIKYENFCRLADNYLVSAGFSGSVLVAKGDRIIFAKGYGLRDKYDDAQGDNDIWTTFETGSLTKQMVGIAFFQLEKKGLLSQDDLLIKYFPELNNKKFERITLRMLLSMRSGLPDHINSSTKIFPRKVRRQIEINQVQNVPLEKDLIMKYLPTADFEAKPDFTYFYSNTNYYLLAKIIEKVSGVSYSEYMSENIFKNAGLTESNFDFQKTSAKGYVGDVYYSIPAEFAFGCGDLNSCVMDLYNWNKSVVSGKIAGKKFVKSLKNAGGYNYGFYCGNMKIFHAGVTNGFNSYSFYDFEKKLTIIVLSNEPVYVCNATSISDGLKNLIKNH